jgi:hypothetical protein
MGILVAVEVVLRSARENNESYLVGEEDQKPEGANTHSSNCGNTLSSPFDVLLLGSSGI